MARLVVKKSHNKYKLFCNTIDQWVSPILSKRGMVDYMLSLNEFKGFQITVLEKVLFYYDDNDEFYSYRLCNNAHRRNK